MVKKSLVEVYIQDADKMGDSWGMLTARWDLPRKFVAYWYTNLEGEAAAEEAFHILNAPDEYLTEEHLQMKGEYNHPSLSVGDVVRVINTEDREYLCASTGWITKSTELSLYS